MVLVDDVLLIAKLRLFREKMKLNSTFFFFLHFVLVTVHQCDTKRSALFR